MPWAYIQTKDQFDGPIFWGAYIQEGGGGLHSGGKTLQQRYQNK